MKSTYSLSIIVYCFLFTCTSQIFAQSVATYDITFTSVWNATDHGTLPSGAHWSNLIGANHILTNEFLQMGTMASLGVESVAETGANSEFENEINASVMANDSEQLINVASVSTATGSVTISNLEIDEQYPLLTLISMIAPSPDWFIALNSYDLRQGGSWVSNATIDLFPYDAGTEEGTAYSTSNAATMPQENITSLVNIAPFNNLRIGYFTINLISVLNVEEELFDRQITLYPNPSSGFISLTNSSTNEIDKIEIYDLIGKQIHTQNIDNQKIVNIDLAQLNSGVYLVKVFSGEINTIKKLIIN
ncbi:MAG: spondin domain-containing protein [Flavobacteriaceae bacterium]